MEKEKNKRKPRKKKPGRDPKMQNFMTDDSPNFVSIPYTNKTIKFEDFFYIPLDKIIDAIIKNKE